MKISFIYLSIFFFIAILFAVFINLRVGYAPVSWVSFFDEADALYPIAQLRLYRVWTMALIGVAIPTAGFLLQEYFQNPLAGPSVLGITSVASLSVAVFIFLSGGFYISEGLQYGTMGFIAIATSIIMMLILLLLSSKIQDNTHLIILGFLVSSLSGAVISLLQLYGENQELKNYILWSFGANILLDGTQLILLTAIILLGMICSFFAINPLIGSAFGVRYAQSFGIDVRKLKWFVVVSSSILSAGITAFLGPIAFVGIIIPHLSRILYNPSRLWHQWAMNILLGIFLLQIFSILSEVAEIPINVITSLFGIPMIFIMMLKRKKRLMK